MANVTATEVKLIIDTSLSDEIIDAFISGAYEALEEAFSEVSISEGLRKELERWVAAHLIASTREQQLQEAAAGSAKAKFQGKTGMDLRSTFYGQNALSLDYTGTLASLGGKGVSIKAIT